MIDSYVFVNKVCPLSLKVDLNIIKSILMYIYKFLTHRLPHIVSVEGHASTALTSLAVDAAAQNLLHGSSTK